MLEMLVMLMVMLAVVMVMMMMVMLVVVVNKCVDYLFLLITTLAERSCSNVLIPVKINRIWALYTSTGSARPVRRENVELGIIISGIRVTELGIIFSFTGVGVDIELLLFTRVGVGLDAGIGLSTGVKDRQKESYNTKRFSKQFKIE